MFNRLVVLSFIMLLCNSCRQERIDDDIITIKVDVTPYELGTVNGSGKYFQGDTVRLTAQSTVHSIFMQWEENGNVLTASNPLIFIASVDRNITARFLDFRQQLYGQYVGTRNNYSWSMSNPSGFDTTFAYSFTVNPHPSLDSIFVDGSAFPIDTSGYFYEMPYPGQIRSLEFIGDTCKIYYRSGGLGGYSTTNCIGVKQ
jgi:hypothetical protein